MIGDHTVTLIPDPDVQSWGPVLNANPYMTDNVTGWEVAPFAAPPWTWNAGQAVGPAAGVGSGAYGLWLAAAPGLARSPGATQYRVRARVVVKASCWVIIGLNYGKTPQAAHDGPFWSGDAAMEQTAWFNAPGAGSFAFDVVVNAGAVPADYGWVAPSCQFYADSPIDAARIDSIELNSQGAEIVDLSCLVDQVAIRHGRDDADTQPEAGTATLDLSLDTGELALPEGLEVGAILRINTVTELTNSPRFVGRITDVNMGWEDVGPETPNALVVQVLAASPLSELGRRIVGDVVWPQELDGARVSRIMSNAGVTLDPTFSDPGTVQIIPRDVDVQAALPLAQEVAQSANGLVWETRAGEVRYADADHRRGATPALALDACDVLVTPTWHRSTEGLINKVSIGYGVAAGGGEQPRYDGDNAASVAAFGRYELSAATQLAALADATALGQMLLVRNSSPVWIMSALPVDVKSLTPEETAALLGLDMHSLVTLTGLPVAGSAPTSAPLWVEGWSETLAAGIHELELMVSGYCRTVPAPQWDDMAPATTWDTMGTAQPTLTNTALNPSTEQVSPSRFTAANCVLTSVTAWAKVGARALRVSVNAVGLTTYLYAQGPMTTPSIRHPCKAGDYVHARASARGLRAPSCAVRLSFLFYNAAGAATGTTHGPAASLANGAVVDLERLNVPVPNDPAIVGCLVLLYVMETVAGGPPTGTGNYCDADAFMVLNSGTEPLTDLPPYFDGDTADTKDDRYEWTGTPNDSPSTHAHAVGPTWDDASCLGPSPTYGRWSDVPASERWSTVDAGISWNTWPY